MSGIQNKVMKCLGETSVSTDKTEEIKKLINLDEKGSDYLILHPGSHTLKFGLASQLQPFMVPMVVAHRLKSAITYKAPLKEEIPISTAILKEGDDVLEMKDYTEESLSNQIDIIESSLTRYKYINIDQKKYKFKKGQSDKQSHATTLTVNNKPLTYKVYNNENYYSEGLPNTEPKNISLLSNDVNEDIVENSFCFNDCYLNRYIGEKALTFDKKDNYIIQYPIKHGYFNITPDQSFEQVSDNISAILQYAISQRLMIPKENYHKFSAVLIIPDLFNRREVKAYLNILLREMQLKSVILALESVMVTYAYAVQSACVVDIGSSKINISCVDEGVLLHNTIIRKNFGGDDLTALLMKLLGRNNSLHYFPQGMLDDTNILHYRSIERLKEQYCSMQINPTDPVKECKLWLYQRNAKTKIVSFNASDILVITPFSLLYSDILNITSPKYTIKEYYTELRKEAFDTDDALHDLIDEINKEKKEEEEKSTKKEEKISISLKLSPSNAPIAVNVEAQQIEKKEEVKKDENKYILWQNKCKLMGTISMNKMEELDSLVAQSITQIGDQELRQRIANNIIFCGGSTKFPGMIDAFEAHLIDRVVDIDKAIERVEVVNATQKDYDYRHIGWIGGSLLPRIESARDTAIYKEKWNGEWIKQDYNEGDSPKSDGSPKAKKQKKELTIHGGYELLREKCGFVWDY